MTTAGEYWTLPTESEQRLEDFLPLTLAEMRVVAGLRSGDFERIGEGLPPEELAPDREVRADLLRFLILGGDEGHRLHEKGLRLSGAQVTGVLDLEGCRIPRDIGLKDCRFDATPVLRSAIIDNLFLDGSVLPGLRADGLEARGGLTLRGATIAGEVRLMRLRLGGNIEADGSTITVRDGLAIDADGLEARGSILLRGASVRGGINFSGVRLGADVNLAGARIERPGEIALNCDGIDARGDLVLRAATLEGETTVLGAHFGGNIDCSSTKLIRPDGFALRLNRTRIEGAFFLRKQANVDGNLDLTAATIGAIHDDKSSWPAPGRLLLNRCQYGAFIGGPVDAASRLDWLARQVPTLWEEDFWPQPYEQLASVLLDMGHDEDARAVLIAKEKLQRRARRRRARNWPLQAALLLNDSILAVTVRYGRQPLYAFLWLFLFWMIGIGVFGQAAADGSLKPNSPVVLRSLEWTMCNLGQDQTRYMPSVGEVLPGRALPGQNQLTCFLSQPEASSYPEFIPWIYSLDTLLPVTELGQKEYWRPDPSQPNGALPLNYYFFQSVAGWALSLLAVAGFSGLVKSR